MSPAALVLRGFTVHIFFPPREHPPAHVHVRKAGAEAIIRLSDGAVLTVHGMRDADVAVAQRIVMDERDMLWQLWRRYHGNTE